MTGSIASSIARSAPRVVAPSRRAAITAALAVATFAVALLHVVFLWERVRSGAILEPAVLLRWTGAALLLWLMRCVLRQEGGTSRLVRSVALASLVALLHLAFAVPVTTTSATEAAPVAIVLPLGLVAALALGALVARVLRSRCRPDLSVPTSLTRCFIEITRLPHFLARHSLAFRAPPAWAVLH